MELKRVYLHYQFWGILAFYLLLSAAYILGSSYAVTYWVSSLHIPPKLVGIAIFSGQAGNIVGIILSWFLCRIKNRYSLFTPALIATLGAMLCWLVNDVSGCALLFVGQFLVGMSQGMVMVLIPVILIGGISSIETYAIIIGISLITNHFLTTFLSLTLVYAMGYLMSLAFAASLIALLLLLPMNKSYSMHLLK